MKLIDFIPNFSKITNKTFVNFFFGCRVNASESNQLSQIIINYNFIQLQHDTTQTPGIILINTCSITQKGENESLRKIRSLSTQFPQSQIIVTGCANIDTIKNIKNIIFIDNHQKRQILEKSNQTYSKKVKDRLSISHKYLLSVQTGCDHFCTYCIVPYKRQQLWSLPIDQATDQVNTALKNGFKEIIITGVNLNKYQPGLSNLVENILVNTQTLLISFGSIPLNCIDDKFISLLKKYKFRIKNFLHIPLQSCSNKTLKNMNRPYNQKQILNTFSKLKKIKNLQFGTDIIVGFPGETDNDFNQTYQICKQIGFSKIHTFRFSLRPGTVITKLKLNKIPHQIKKSRSQKIRSLISQTKLPSHQTLKN